MCSPQNYRSCLQIHVSLSIYKLRKMFRLAIFHLSCGHLVYIEVQVFLLSIVCYNYMHYSRVCGIRET